MRRYLFLILMILLTACGDKNAPGLVPTLADPQAIQTDIVKTQNAPPPGFESVAFNPIDYNREALPGVIFEVTVNFTGQYTATGQDASSSMVMTVRENGLQRTRDVTLSFIGQALSGATEAIEAVRFENDFYLMDMKSRVCSKNTPNAEQIANLSASNVVGGFTLALPTGIRGEINGFQGYQYGFAKENLTINIFSEPPSAVEVTGGEVWILPQYNVVGRFGVAMTIHNAKILFGTEPVTGTLRYEYNLNTIGYDELDLPNIAIPNGC